MTTDNPPMSGLGHPCGVWLAVSGLGPRMAGCHRPADHDGPHQHKRLVDSLVEGAPPAVETIQWWTEPVLASDDRSLRERL